MPNGHPYRILTRCKYCAELWFDGDECIACGFTGTCDMCGEPIDDPATMDPTLCSMNCKLAADAETAADASYDDRKAGV